MTLLKNVTDCSTYAVRGLDEQLIWQINLLRPGAVVKIDNLNIDFGAAVHPWLQAAAAKTLGHALAHRGEKMIVNSAWRTIAAQQLLRSHYENQCCGIVAAAQPGKSNHNNASAIDIEDADGWEPFLSDCDWRRLGSFDPMHFDCVALDIQDIRALSVQAFQKLWSLAFKNDPLASDGSFGENTQSRLLNSPAEGFANLPVPRILRLTDPVQMGDDVGFVQLALRSHGIDLVADKCFGKQTSTAVYNFQASKSLISDGIVGAKTRVALGL